MVLVGKANLDILKSTLTQAALGRWGIDDRMNNTNFGKCRKRPHLARHLKEGANRCYANRRAIGANVIYMRIRRAGERWIFRPHCNEA